MNRSIYVRVPNDIAHIIGLDNQVEVRFSFEDIGDELRLIYSLTKSKPESTTREQPNSRRETSEQQTVRSGIAKGQATGERPEVQCIAALSVQEHGKS
jgi:hypothetical protein